MECELTWTLMWERLGNLRGHETGVMGCPTTKLLGWMWTCMATSVEDEMGSEEWRAGQGGRVREDICRGRL